MHPIGWFEFEYFDPIGWGKDEWNGSYSFTLTGFCVLPSLSYYWILKVKVILKLISFTQILTRIKFLKTCKILYISSVY